MISNCKFQISNLSKEKGFTVIELLVVIAIISVLVTIVISNFPQIRLQLALSRAAYKLDQDIRSVQNLAVATKQYKDSLGNIQPVNGYGIYIDLNDMGNKKYLLYADSPSGQTDVNGVDFYLSNKYYDFLDYIVKEIDFSSDYPGVVIKEINSPLSGSAASVNFDIYDFTTSLFAQQPYQSTETIDIVFALESNLNNTRTVSVNDAGSITIR